MTSEDNAENPREGSSLLGNDEGSALSGGIKKMGILRLLFLTGYNFPYGSIMGSFGLFVLPREAELFVGEDDKKLRVWLLAIFIGVCGISQLVCPLAGRYSDTHTSKLGRRRPLLIYGTFFMMLSSLCLLVFSYIYPNWELYTFFLFTAMISINAAYSAQAGLVPDLVPESQHGIASGMTAVHALVGSCCGFFFVVALPGHHYPIYLFLPILFATFTTGACLAGAEKSFELEDLPEWNFKDVLACFKLDVKSDFFKVFLGRTAYYSAVAVQNFILYYIRDLVLDGHNSQNETDDAAKAAVIKISLLGQISGAIVAYPASHITNTQKGRKRMIYIANLAMAITYLGFAIVPDAPYEQIRLHYLYLLGVFYGVGNGVFLSVDLALALETLPSKMTATQNLGIWGLSAFLGSFVGVSLWSSLLYMTCLHCGFDSQYTRTGYTVMVIGGCGMCILSAIFISKVKHSNYEEENDKDQHKESSDMAITEIVRKG